MVHSTIIVSALFALVAFVSAAPRPHGSLVGVDADYIGTGDIDAEGALNNVVNANDLEIEDVLQDIAILGSLKKRDVDSAAAPPAVRIARQADY